MKKNGDSILIVEDEKVTRRILASMLARQGYDVAEAESCAQAREAYTLRVPVLIFLDIELEGTEGNGLDFSSWVREQETGKHIPIVVGTSHSEKEYVQKAVAAGANDFLVKPYKVLSVKERLAKYLGK